MSSLFGPGITIFFIFFLGCLVFLYILSILWARSDAEKRGGSQKKAMLISLIPFAGVLAYVLMRPPLYTIDKQEQKLDIALKRRQLTKYGNCSNCGTPVKDNYLFCPNCQIKLKDPCVNCDKPLDFSWKVCPYCGTPKPEESSFAVPDEEIKQEKRKSHKKTTTTDK